MKTEEFPQSEYLEDGETALVIPNQEVRTILSDTIVEWFKDKMQGKPLITALWYGKAEKASSILTDRLFQTISYHIYK